MALCFTNLQVPSMEYSILDKRLLFYICWWPEAEEESAWISVYNSHHPECARHHLSSRQSRLVRFCICRLGLQSMYLILLYSPVWFWLSTSCVLSVAASGHPPSVEVGQGNRWRIQASLPGSRRWLLGQHWRWVLIIKIKGCRRLMHCIFSSLYNVRVTYIKGCLTGSIADWPNWCARTPPLTST